MARLGYLKTRNMRLRKPRTVRLALVIASMVVPACSGGSDTAPSSSATPTSVMTQPPVVVTCDEATGLFEVDAVWTAEDHPCGAWLDAAIGRAIRGSTGSATLWTRRTPHGTALVVGAVHTLGEGWFGPAGSDIDEALMDPGGQVGIPRLHLMLADGTGPDTLASPLFMLYRPAIAAERTGNRMQDVLPREDFYVGVADAQKIAMEGPVATPKPIVLGPLELLDPAGSTTATETWAEPASGDLVMMLGFPHETGRLTGSVGRLLGDDEAAAAVAMLAEIGDSEGEVPFEADVELMVQGAAIAGMSGGPVVDTTGRLVGVLVRASDEHDGVQYVRAVRMSHVVDRLGELFAGLAEGDRVAIAEYLER